VRARDELTELIAKIRCAGACRHGFSIIYAGWNGTREVCAITSTVAGAQAANTRGRYCVITGEGLVSRCGDNFWLWAAIAVAIAANDDRCGCSCDCERDRYQRFDDESYSPARTVNPPPQNPGRSVLAFAAVGIVVAIAAFLALGFSASSASTRPVPLPVASHLTATPLETEPEQPLAQPSPDASDAEPPVQPAPLVESPSPDAAPLHATALVTSDAMLTYALGSEPSLAVGSMSFDVGSTREEVMAAQGGPPTYSARHQRMLWWGSSRVEFDDSGHVRSWVSGTPPLNVSSR
jgi:hypothetical protein